VVAAFWAEPLVSREYEQQTHLLAWSQNVSPLRWLAGKGSFLLAAAAAGAVVLGLLDRFMIYQLTDATPADGLPIAGFHPPYFAAAPLVQVGYVLFAFALGIALSALTRRTLVSMGTSLVVFLVTRFALGVFARPHYEPPMRVTFALGTGPPGGIPHHALRVGGGLLDTSGTPTPFPDACRATRGLAETCLPRHGVVGRYVDYQPPSRIADFQLIEFGIFTTLAVLLFLLTWQILRCNSSHL
jgi:hypothetical protein